MELVLPIDFSTLSAFYKTYRHYGIHLRHGEQLMIGITSHLVTRCQTAVAICKLGIQDHSNTIHVIMAYIIQKCRL